MCSVLRTALRAPHNAAGEFVNLNTVPFCSPSANKKGLELA
jgi:hypothetical protein